MSEITIAERKIGVAHAPFVIAEMSGNHNQSLERALAIVEAVASSGAHAVKLQTYTADTMTLDLCDGDFFINDPNSLWDGNSLYDLYKRAYTPWEWHRPIMDRCRELGLICFSTPFDDTAVDFLETLDVPCYKVASFENADIPLIRKIAATGKPLIISTGMATVSELDETVRVARSEGCNNMVLLKCTSTYPAAAEHSNIRTIPHLRDLFGVEVGISDHTLGIGAAVASIALGASVIEKHFTLCRDDGGVDAAFSIEPDEMAALVSESVSAWQALGHVCYGTTASELASLRFRRSLYIAEDMMSGDKLTTENMKIVRPGYGLAPKYYEIVLGKKIRRDVKKGTAVTWEMV